ncbi:MAG: ClbS/DfsB family four-helix bundle protein [Chloroflexia bacterium]
MDKDELLEKLAREHAQLEEAIAQLSEEQMTAPGVYGEWSVRDILAHLTVWDVRGSGWIRTAASGAMPEIPGPGLTWKDAERLNEETYQENRARPLADVLADYRDGYARMLTQLRALTDEDWAKPYRKKSIGQPNEVATLAGWRYGHLSGHSKPIHELVSKLRRAAAGGPSRQ